MVETQTLEQEININFSIQDVEVAIDRDKYRKLYIKIRDSKMSQSEIQFQYLSPEYLTISRILKNIYKLNAIYRLTDNNKLAEGAKEEILKLIALLIWSLERERRA